MIPDYVHSDCKSSGEKKVYQRLQGELSDDFTILHSLALAKHQKKLRSEIDFLIINKMGILCIEVKGGRIEHSKGVWFFTDRYGETHKKRESPFEQASSNMYAIKRSIINRFGVNSVYAGTTFGYCVVFPDIEFSLHSPEWDLNRIIDRKKAKSDFYTVIKDQYEYSSKELQRVQKNYRNVYLSDNDIKRLTRFLRGDFHFIPSLSSIIENGYKEIISLTEEQYDILDQLNENPRVVVQGNAGTGKTILAVEKCRREARRGKNVLYVCFNRLLARKIDAKLKKDGYENKVKASTLHSYARTIIEKAGLLHKIEGLEGSELFKKKFPEIFGDAFITTFKEAPYDVLVVDEGQDLKSKADIEMLDWLLKGGLSSGNWIWMEDNQQNLFNKENFERNTDLMNFKPAIFKLTKNCRNTLPICMFNSLVSGASLQKCLIKQGPVVETHFYRSKNHHIKELIKVMNRLLSEGVNPVDVIILTTVKNERSILNDLKYIANLKLIPYESKGILRKSIKYSTIHSFKGLEAKIIIILDIEDLDSSKARCLNYVGFSRAMTLLVVFMNENLMERYEILAQNFGQKIADS